jgi:2-amino-4-hydroxy-6-hydroxymethyldihydropteridine diphosphokinase
MNNYVVVLGSNLSSEQGTSAEILKKCVYEIRYNPAVEFLLESNWYISSSFLDNSEPSYINVGLRFRSNFEPAKLLDFTSGLEQKYGRKRQKRWEPRTCDIDILLCDQLILPDRLNYGKWLNMNLADQIKLVPEELILPHPRLQERTFFLEPLNDLQPDWNHPFLKMKAKEMLDSLPPNELENIQKLIF